MQNDVVAEGSPDSIAREKQLRTLQRRTRKDETWFKRAMEVPIGRLIGLSIQTKVTLISEPIRIKELTNFCQISHDQYAARDEEKQKVQLALARSHFDARAQTQGEYLS